MWTDLAGVYLNNGLVGPAAVMLFRVGLSIHAINFIANFVDVKPENIGAVENRPQGVVFFA